MNTRVGFRLALSVREKGRQKFDAINFRSVLTVRGKALDRKRQNMPTGNSNYTFIVTTSFSPQFRSLFS